MSEEERCKSNIGILGILGAMVGLVAAWKLFKDAGQLSSEQAPVTVEERRATSTVTVEERRWKYPAVTVEERRALWEIYHGAELVEERRALWEKYHGAELGIASTSLLAVLSIPFTRRCMWKHPWVWCVGLMTVSLICDSVARYLPYDYEKRFDLKHGVWLTESVFEGAAVVPFFALLIGLPAADLVPPGGWIAGATVWFWGMVVAPAWDRTVGGVKPHIRRPLKVALLFGIGCFIFSVVKTIHKDNTPFDPMYYHLIRKE